MTLFRKTLGVVGVGTVVYGLWIRPRLMRWGASDQEVSDRYPGADLLVGGKRAATMAITVKASPEQIWPWLLQLGGDRAGWYSWDRLDNAGRPSATAVHPQWQSLAVGDHVKYLKQNGPEDAWVVAALEPNRFLGLRGLTDLRGRNLDAEQPRPFAYTEGLWGFQLKQLPDGRTRLIIGGYQTFRPRAIEPLLASLLLPVVWIMQARMLVVLKRSIESAADVGTASR